eukprot:1557718-Rhodomonas_salina.1
MAYIMGCDSIGAIHDGVPCTAYLKQLQDQGRDPADLDKRCLSEGLVCNERLPARKVLQKRISSRHVGAEPHRPQKADGRNACKRTRLSPTSAPDIPKKSVKGFRVQLRRALTSKALFLTLFNSRPSLSTERTDP